MRRLRFNLVVLAIAITSSSFGTAHVPTGSAQLVQATPETAEQPPAGKAAIVASISDADSVQVEYDGETHAIRLVGADAPAETGDYSCQYLTSFAYLQNLLPAGTMVVLEADSTPRDAEGVLLKHVWLEVAEGAWQEVNLLMIASGFAVTNLLRPDPLDFDRSDRFMEFEAMRQSAQQAGRGMWDGSCAEETIPAFGPLSESERNYVLDLIFPLSQIEIGVMQQDVLVDQGNAPYKDPIMRVYCTIFSTLVADYGQRPVQQTRASDLLEIDFQELLRSSQSAGIACIDNDSDRYQQEIDSIKALLPSVLSTLDYLLTLNKIHEDWMREMVNE